MAPGFQSPQDHAAALAFFQGHDAAHALFHRVLQAVATAGPFELAATKSRVSLVARTRFVWCHEANEDGSIWLGFLLPRRVDSPRLRSGPVGSRWSHHVKVRDGRDLDAELVGWLREAYEWDRDGIKGKSVKAPRSRARSGGHMTKAAAVARSPEEFFASYPHGLPIYRKVLAVLRSFGPVEPAGAKTQVSFKARTQFAWLWVPQQVLRRGPPDVYLEFGLPHRLRSSRVKEATEVRPGRWVHHVRIDSARDVDEEVEGWLREAYESNLAGPKAGAHRKAAR